MKFLPLFFFLLALITGIFLFDDYGVSYDEPIQRDLGNANWNYILHQDDSWFSGINQYYGPFIEMIEVMPERIFHLHDPRAIYLTRHFINFIIFWIGSIFFFLLAKELFRKNSYALLTVVLLYLTPRILAHSFYNSKDLPLLSFFCIANYFQFRFLKHPEIRSTVLFAIATGMLFSIRVVGVIVPVFAAFFFLLSLRQGRIPFGSIKFLFVYLALSLLFTGFFYPVLWHNPVEGLKKCFTIMSHFPYDQQQFFLGRMIAPKELPWYYIPVWMGVTVPIMWQVFFLIGILATIVHLIRKKFSSNDQWQWLSIISWLFVPWIAVLILHSTLYDEWRHLFFIYPAFVLLAVAGIKFILESFARMRNGKWRLSVSIIVVSLIAIQSIDILWFMVRNHPYENVYFNRLAGKKPQEKFYLDYWGLSYRQALAYLVKNDANEQIKVCWANAPGTYNLIWLTVEQRQRISEVAFDSSDYYLTNFKFNPEEYTDSTWFTVKADNMSILAVEKLGDR